MLEQKGPCLTFYSACSLLRTSPYYCLCLLPPLHFTLLLPPPSLTLCPTIACSLLRTLPCYLHVPSHFVLLFQPKYCCRSLPLVLLLIPSHFTLLLAWCELVFPCFSMFCNLRNLEQTWSFKLFQLGKFSFNLILLFFLWVSKLFCWVQTNCFVFFYVFLLNSILYHFFLFLFCFVLFCFFIFEFFITLVSLCVYF